MSSSDILLESNSPLVFLAKIYHGYHRVLLSYFNYQKKKTKMSSYETLKLKVNDDIVSNLKQSHLNLETTIVDHDRTYRGCFCPGPCLTQTHYNPGQFLHVLSHARCQKKYFSFKYLSSSPPLLHHHHFQIHIT